MLHVSAACRMVISTNRELCACFVRFPVVYCTRKRKNDIDFEKLRHTGRLEVI